MFIGLFLIIVVGFFGVWYTQTVQENLAAFKYAIETEQIDGFDKHSLQSLAKTSASFPSLWPLSSIKDITNRAYQLQNRVEQLSLETVETAESQIKIEKLLTEIFDITDQGLVLIKDTQSLLNVTPIVFLSPEIRLKIDEAQQQIEQIKTLLTTIHNFETTFDHFYKNNSRLALLLQNQNEPRSTGGFIGSLVLVDFKADKTISWEFKDIYALDRKIPPDVQIPAPEFFHDLARNISLRDANFWPDFPLTAETIREFFTFAGEEPPEIVVAINLKVAEELIRLTGPVRLEKWGLTLNEDNFDTVLQFLVEGKISGRFNVKEPVNMVIKKILSAENLKKLNQQALLNFDWKSFLAQKNLLAYSTNKSLQKHFDAWNISGRLQQKSTIENFLHFDFVSIGANKSEKFVWTKINHDSEIFRNGKVINTLKITRNHALRPGEIDDLLRSDELSENVRDLITDDIRWKLGAGENRTVLRVWIPKNATLFGADNPAGEVQINTTFDPNFDVLEIPLNVLPGEKLVATVKYGTEIHRGSQNWRPYHLQLVGTPGRDQTKIYTSISTEERGKFTAETFNIGRPTDLIDQDFRAVIEFE